MMKVNEMTVQQKLSRANELNALIEENSNAIEESEKIKGKCFEMEFFNIAGRSRNYYLKVTEHSDLIIDTLVSCMKKDVEAYKEELTAIFK
jgi:hypothetical protein